MQRDYISTHTSLFPLSECLRNKCYQFVHTPLTTAYMGFFLKKQSLIHGKLNIPRPPRGGAVLVPGPQVKAWQASHHSSQALGEHLAGPGVWQS